MNETARKCIGCGSELEAGLVIDKTYTGPVETVFQQTWVAIFSEEVKTSAWRQGALKNLKGRRRRDVVSFRCSKCGLLHSHAG